MFELTTASCPPSCWGFKRPDSICANTHPFFPFANVQQTPPRCSSYRSVHPKWLSRWILTDYRRLLCLSGRGERISVDTSPLICHMSHELFQSRLQFSFFVRVNLVIMSLWQGKLVCQKARTKRHSLHKARKENEELNVKHLTPYLPPESWTVSVSPSLSRFLLLSIKR